MSNTPATYNIKLPQFEGPFDLLLFFIERDELDIYNIPIAQITNDFLDYIRDAKQLNIDLASEFILVAATLIKIKAKMLLPRKQLNVDGSEVDPREELVQRLLEYKQYKEAVKEFSNMEDQRMLLFKRGNTEMELAMIAKLNNQDEELESLTLYKLMHTFSKVLNNLHLQEKKIEHKVYNYPYTIIEQQDFIKSKLKPGKKTNCESLFKSCKNRIHAIVTFLALLELINDGIVLIINGIGVNNFWLEVAEETPKVST